MTKLGTKVRKMSDPQTRKSLSLVNQALRGFERPAGFQSWEEEFSRCHALRGPGIRSSSSAPG